MLIIGLRDVLINSVATFSPSTLFVGQFVMRVIVVMVMMMIVVVALSVAAISKLYQ